jgi:hypothetical protein
VKLLLQIKKNLFLNKDNNAAHLSKLVDVALDVGMEKWEGRGKCYVFLFLQPKGFGQNVGTLLAVDDSNTGGGGC